MDPDRVDQVLTDFFDLPVVHADVELESIKTALMLEDVFGVRLSDDDIGSNSLSTAAEIKELLTRRQSNA